MHNDMLSNQYRGAWYWDKQAFSHKYSWINIGFDFSSGMWLKNYSAKR